MKYTLGNSRLEVNGKQYLKDVGGYNGTNKDSSKDVATVIGSKIDSMLSVNYLELVNLRDNGKLIPGQQYRIIDYITTTSQENTESAGHQFDIIVTANSNNTLSEIASACLHEGDTYFSENNANLSAWQIWYCLDNDTNRFKWATTGHSYDSDNNLYEFDNWVTAVGKVCDDQIDAFYETEINEKFSHFNYTENLDGIIVPTLYGRNLHGDVDEGLAKAIPYHYKGVYNVDGVYYDGWAQLYISDNGVVKSYAKDENDNSIYVLTERIVANYGNGDIIKRGNGVIYRMIDEYGNDCPYDFKNIKFTKPIISETDTPDSNFYYTFCNYNVNGSNVNGSIIKDIKDASIYVNDYNVYNNVIKPYYVHGKQSLNRILFTGIECGFLANTFGNNCYNNIFGEYCNRNTFGDNCYNNKFGSSFFNNKFGNGCDTNTFGNFCTDNTFGNECNSNTFGASCKSNTFGNGCDSNTFGNECKYNTFGNFCKVNEFGHKCNSNKFAEECEKNKLGKEATITISTNCAGNTFGNDCKNNTFGVYCLGNILGNWCDSNTFGNDSNYNTFGNYCQFNTFGTYCEFNVFGEMCNSIRFGNFCQFNTFGNGCFNIIFGEMSSSGKVTIKSYYKSITFDDMCNSIYLNCKKITSTSSYYQYVKVDLGVSDMSIDDTNVNQTYLTIYKPKNVKTLTV